MVREVHPERYPWRPTEPTLEKFGNDWNPRILAKCHACGTRFLTSYFVDELQNPDPDDHDFHCEKHDPCCGCSEYGIIPTGPGFGGLGWKSYACGHKVRHEHTCRYRKYAG